MFPKNAWYVACTPDEIDGLAKELNVLLDRCQYFRETSNDDSDQEAERATLSIAQHVMEFDNIEPRA